MSLLYPIVGTIERARFFLRGEVPYLQLRFKNQNLAQYSSQIEEWLDQYPNTRIVINDGPELANHIGTWGVHLGQEDLAKYQSYEFKKSGLNLGISTHSWEKIEKSLEYDPFYLDSGQSLRHKPNT